MNDKALATANSERDRLILEFPRVYGKLRGGQFECGPGWTGILREFAEKADAFVLPDEQDFVIVKDKFGTLRLQGFAGPPELRALADEAERRSYTVCQKCGNDVEDNSWGSGSSCGTCKGPKVDEADEGDA